MYILWTILIIILIALILLALFPVKIAFAYTSEELSSFYMKASWLNPFFKATIIKQDYGFTLKIFIFNQRIYKKNIVKKPINYNDNINLIKSIDPSYIKLNTSYGFEDPAVTGMICGLINMFSQNISIDSLSNNPNFNTDFSYFNIKGIIKINAIYSFIKLLKSKRKNLLIQT